MGQGHEADEVRREIEEVRGDLGGTLEEISERMSSVREQVVDKVSPRRVVARRTERVRSTLRGVKESVVGSTTNGASNGNGRLSEAADAAKAPVRQVGQAARAARGQAGQLSERASTRAQDAAGALTEAAGSAPQSLREKALANPFAAGAVAFGGGMLLASLLKPTERERQAAQKVKEKIEPLKSQAIEAGRSIAGELQPAAQASVEQVKGRAGDAARQVKEEATGSAEQVKTEAQGATSDVKRRAKAATEEVKGEAKRSARTAKEEVAQAAEPSRRGRSRPRAASESGSAPTGRRRRTQDANPASGPSRRTTRAKSPTG